MAEMSMEEFKAKLERWHKDYPKECEKAMKRAAEAVRTEVVSKHLSGPKMASGATSLSNATLGRVSGDLAESITTSVKSSGGKIIAEIGNMKFPLRYAVKWEKGGRPFLAPSIDKKRDAILDMLTKAIKESYNDA